MNLKWLDEEIAQAREAIAQARGAPLFFVSAMARYVALCQVRERLRAPGRGRWP